MIGFIIEATVALLIFYAFFQAFLAQESMFRFNRFFLLFALCFSLIVPLLQLPFGLRVTESLFPQNPFVAIPSSVEMSPKEVPPPQLVAEPGETEISPQSHPTTAVDWYTIGLVIYLLGLVFFFTRFILQLLRLVRLIRTGVTVKDEGCTYVLLSHKTLPFTFLNFMFVEKEAFQNEALEKEILFHEWTHIQQKHSWDILLVEILRTVFWFNPLLLLYKRAIQLNHEFLADAAVAAKFEDKTGYQWLLFNKVSGSQADLSLSSPFNLSSTKSRLIMMGKSSSKRKTRLLKIFSLVIAGTLTILLSSSQSLSTPFQSGNDFEQILSNAFKDGNPHEVELHKLDLYALRDAYLALDEHEKYTGTEFQFFEALTLEKLVELQQAYPRVKTKILFAAPPKRQELQQEVFEQWKKTKNISITIDEREIQRKDLEHYQPADFALYTVRGTEGKGMFNRTAYHITLMTNEYYFGKYLKSTKRIELIQAEYPDGEEVAVSYGTKHTETAEGKFTKLSPENYEASIFHQLRVIDPSRLKWEFRNAIVYDSSKSFSIVISSNEGREITVMKLPTI